MNDTWLGIIKKELEQAIAVSGTAIVGAKLRQLVANAARAQGLTFPPPEIPRFSSLVESFPAEFIVQRFPGSDILIVPANRPELLVKDAPRSKNVRMRQDLFDAMTTVESHRKAAPYYLPDKDAVVWVDQNERLPASAVALPRASLDGELEARKKFIEVTAQSEAIRKSLDKALAGDSPLRFFGEAVRAHGLVKDWHQFRMGELTARLKRWSAETALPWTPVAT